MYCELRKHNPMPEFEVNDEFDVLKEAEEISAEHNPEKL